MTDSNATDSPNEAGADVTRARATEAFSLLGNETRLGILLALWEAYDPFAEGTWDPTEGNAVPFSDLRDHVGTRDSGKFNYHLGKLEGQFVEQTSDGYQLLPAGHKVVRAVIASAGYEEASLAPTEIDWACGLCDAPTAITFQNQRLYWVCTECDGNFALRDKHPSGVLGTWIANPASLSQRTPEATLAATLNQVYYQFALTATGICSWCSGQVEARLHVCDAHDPGSAAPCPVCGRQTEWAARFVCTVCKHTSQSVVSGCGLKHPAVVAFLWDHGIELGNANLETHKLIMNIIDVADEDPVSREPPRVRVTIYHDGDEIQLTYDEAVNVVEVSESDVATG